MIRITMQDLKKKSPSCTDDCDRYVETGCSGHCGLRFRTVFTCPICHTVHAFYGADNPSKCRSCNKTILDMYLMKSNVTTSTRVLYHKGDSI